MNKSIPPKIESAQKDDLPSILEILNHEIINGTANYDYDTHDLSDLSKWWSDRTSKDLPVLIAKEDGVVMGYATYGQYRQKRGYQYCVEHTVYVHHLYRGKGIGLLLMKALIEHAAHSGMHTMVAGIDAKNSSSIRFHESLGFEMAGVLPEVGYKFGSWLDLAFMVRKL